MTIVEFGGFQDPFTRKAEPTLRELQAADKDKIRLVWRHKLPFHKDAPLASEAAMEALAQKGNDAFWAMHDLMLNQQAEEGGLQLPALEIYARQLSLDLPRFRDALEKHIHTPSIQADLEASEQANINATPSFLHRSRTRLRSPLRVIPGHREATRGLVQGWTENGPGREGANDLA